MIIYSYEKFVEFINDDIAHRDMRIVRFINSQNLKTWVKIKNFLALKLNNQIKLSSFCYGEDLTPELSGLYAELEEIDENTLLIPLSEHLRINYSESETVLKHIINTQFVHDIYSAKAHLYIPMYRMKNVLKLLLTKDPRLNENIIFVEYNEEDDYSLTIISKDIKSYPFQGHILKGYKDYLKYWEEKPSEPLILYTDNAPAFDNKVFSDNVNILVSAFDIIKFLNYLPYNIEEEYGNEWLWNKLLRQFQSTARTGNLSLLLFNKLSVDIDHLFLNWEKSDDYQKWLIWLWSKLEIKKGYMAGVMQESSDFKYLVQDLTCHIFNCFTGNPQDFLLLYLERKKYMRNFQLEELPTKFWEMLDGVTDTDKLFYLTDTTKTEREYIIDLMGKLNINDKINNFLQHSYPNLYFYLKEYSFEDNLYTHYFNLYKMQKIKNHFSDEFVTKVSEIASKKGLWWELKPRNSLVDEAYNDKTLILWLDAFGVEFLSLVQNILDLQYKDLYFYIQIGHANIPTITEYNKDFVKGRKYEYHKELDDLKHTGNYPCCVEEELEIIKKVISKAVQKLEVYNRVIITSDHGASRGAIRCKGNSYKASEKAKIGRFGRYCIDPYKSYENIYEGCIAKQDQYIFANYDRFSISGNEKSEIHGGATLEEVLVPIVVLSKEPLEEKVVIKLLETEIKLKPGIAPKIKFKVNAEFDELYASIDAVKYVCKKERDYWYFEPEVGQADYYTAKILSKGTIGEFNYKIIKGRTDSDEFNI